MRAFAALAAAVAVIAAATASEFHTSTLPPLFPSPDEVLQNGPSCVWKLPSKMNDEFSVYCVMPAPAVVSLRRQLCVPPHANQSEPPRNLSTTERRLERLAMYMANGTYDPTQIGMYLLTILSDGVHSPFPQLILPIVRIEANRRDRRDVDIVTCIVEGDFVHGNLSLLVDQEPVLEVPADLRDGFASPDGRTKVTVVRTNDTVRFRIRLPTSRAERRYICRFLIPACVVPASSEPLTVSSKAVNIETHYAVDVHRVPHVARLCCRYGGPHPENLIWSRSTDCTHYEPVTQYVRDGYEGYILGHEEFVSKLSTRPRSPSYYKYNVTYCLSSIENEGLRLPPGSYQCIVRNGYGVAYERSVTLPSPVDVSMRLEGSLLHIGCRFHRGARGKLDIERLPDGNVVYTLPLNADLGPETDPSAQISVNGSAVSVEVTLENVLMVGSSFRCRVSDRCEVRSSKILNALPPAPTRKTQEKVILVSLTKPAGEARNLTMDPETVEELRKWTYVTSTVATMFVIAVFVLLRFS